ncbi:MULTISPECIES: glycosyltransferase family 4 protein [Pseudomonas]|uniref:Glycosyltransferase family 4 protein n=1 Tax=Pseudomonas mosselii TaxID=78327 RepID=A0A5R8Z5P9_9PSED|nr:glycosyltransferase family 4 protein [Pseudomonas mosselii]TLP61138.1 glycosyltransferase family 4 protein [Pseudomonas mosselii]
MKIAVVYQYYQGHCAPGHSLVYELTQYLAERGHAVSVVSGETGYMRAEQPKLPWYRRLIRRERDGAVEVVRTYTYSQLHRSYLGRLCSFLSFSLTAPLGLWRIEKPDVVLASSPPIFPMFTVWLVCKIRRIPLVFEVRDLWPESAVQMGILRNRQLIAIMSWMERLLYDQAQRIVTLTQGIHDDIVRRGWPAERLEVITCGVDGQMLYPDPEAGERLRARHGWQNRKIVLYMGAMGEANNLDVLLDAAQLHDHEDVLYLLVGDGMKRTDIQRRIAESGVSNVELWEPVAKRSVRECICAADLCVVTLQDIPLFRGAIPTKLLDYMACGRAVLCGVQGEAAQIVLGAQAGVVCAPSDAGQMASLLADLLQDEQRRQHMGERGAAHVRAHFNAQKCRGKMEKLLEGVVAARTAE